MSSCIRGTIHKAMCGWRQRTPGIASPRGPLPTTAPSRVCRVSDAEAHEVEHIGKNIKKWALFPHGQMSNFLRDFTGYNTMSFSRAGTAYLVGAKELTAQAHLVVSAMPPPEVENVEE